MQHKSLNQLLCAATVNGRFRETLLRNPAKALAAGYGDHTFALTPEERDLVLGIQAQRLEDFAAQVHRWLSTNGNGHKQGVWAWRGGGVALYQLTPTRFAVMREARRLTGQMDRREARGKVDLGYWVEPILEAVPCGVAVEDDAGRIVFANRAAEQIAGCEPGKLAGRRWDVLIPREVYQAVGTWRSGTLGEGTGPYETKVYWADRTAVPVLISACPLADDSRPKAMVWLLTDLTERYRQEAQLRQAEKMAWLGQSTSSVAHELNNPLTVILLQIKLLHAIAPLLPRFQESLAMIQQQAQRMVTIIDNLLTFAHPRAAPSGPTDVNAAVQRTVDLQLYQLQGSGIEVLTDLDPDLPASRVDPHQLEQVFVNLINNARQALLAGDQAGVLVIQTRRAAGQNGDSPHTQVLFIDNGPGIAPEAMGHLFEPFFTTKAPGQGTGLGLAVCDRIVREYGGRIWAHNNPGGGATFTVELPGE